MTVDGHEFYRMGAEATLITYPVPPADAVDSIRSAVTAAARSGADSLQITVGLDYPGGDTVAHVLTTMSAAALGIVDILAMDLSTSPIEIGSLATGVDVIEVQTYEEFAEFERTSALGWGYPMSPRASIQSAYRTLAPGSFLAYHDGIPTGTGGFTLVGPVARLWGASVVPAMRGRGVYRALVALRLINAAARGATLALVHAESTSSPILQQLGFLKFGELRTFRVDTARQAMT